jgi:hypothetical protein
MFTTIGHTVELMKQSWGVLRKDRELVAFPIIAGVLLLVAAGAFALAGAAAGTFDRVDETSGQSLNALDALLGVAFYFVASFIVIFCNAALVAAAVERLRGGDPNVASGLRAAAAHLPQIAGWALIAGTVGLLLQALRSRSDNLLGRIAIGLVGGAWAVMTFFVVPLLVIEGVGPIEAIRRSGGLLRETWGRQVTASFGFGLVYVAAFIAAAVPAALAFVLHPVLGLLVAVPLFALAIGTVQALEGIFKAALFTFARGETTREFDRTTLSAAYRAL